MFEISSKPVPSREQRFESSRWRCTTFLEKKLYASKNYYCICFANIVRNPLVGVYKNLLGSSRRSPSVILLRVLYFLELLPLDTAAD
jgi:hypothetical protein